MKNKLLKDTAVLTLNNVLTLVTGMVGAKIMAVVFTRNEYGLNVQVNMTAGILLAFFTMGLPDSPNYFLPSAKTNLAKREFVSQLYTIYNIIGLIASIVIFFLFGDIVKYFNNPELARCMPIIIFLPWIRLIGSAYGGIMVSQGRVKEVAHFGIIRTFISIGVLAILWFARISIVQLIYINFFVELLFSILMFFLSFRLVGGMNFFTFNFALLKKIFKFAFPLGLAGLVGTLSIETSRLFVSYYSNTEQLALYTNMSKELPLNFITTSFIAVLFPQITKLIKNHEEQKALKLWGYVIEFSCIIMFFGIAVLIVFSREIILLLYSEKYIEGQPIFIVFALLLITRITYFGMILNAKGMTKFIFFSSLTALLLNIVFNYIFYHIIGTIGLALGTLLSTVIILILQLIFTSKVINVGFPKVFPWLALFKIMVINFIIAIPFGMIHYYIFIDRFGNLILISIILGAIWLAIYGLIMIKHLKLLSRKMSEMQVEL